MRRFAATCLVLLFACEKDAPPRDDDGTLPTTDVADSGASDGRIPLDAGPGLADVVGATDACQEGRLTCDTAGCIDTTKDPAHCGGCHRACDSGQCNGGSCVP